jgi:AI-2 transport protein TqsA
MQRLTSFTLSFILVYLVGTIVIAGQSFFIPFLIALMIAYLIIALAEWVRKITRLPMGIAYFCSISGIVGILYVVSVVVSGNIQTLIELIPVYQIKLEALIHGFFEQFNLPQPEFANWFGELSFASFLGEFAYTIRDIASRAGIITLYVIFMMIEYHYFYDKFAALFKTKEGLESAENIMSKIAQKTKSYLRIKTFLSLTTASISYLLLLIVGVDFAEFWALLIFLLNYIPTIGSVVSTIFPCLLTLLQFETFLPFVIVTTGLVTLQFVVGNLIEPRVMGNYFNLSGLVIILSLTITGYIWGVIGMILCVPILMMISIILSSFPSTRPVAVILSKDGSLED